MKVIYVAGPYRGHVDSPWTRVENTRIASLVARRLWANGNAVICPHKNADNLDGPGIPNEAILDGCLEIVKRCDLLVICPGWEYSVGTKMEIEIAESEDIPVLYVEDWQLSVTSEALMPDLIREVNAALRKRP